MLKAVNTCSLHHQFFYVVLFIGLLIFLVNHYIHTNSSHFVHPSAIKYSIRTSLQRNYSISQTNSQPVNIIALPVFIKNESQMHIKTVIKSYSPTRPAVKKVLKTIKSRIIIEPDAAYIDYGYEEHIRKIPGLKTGTRQDLRVILNYSDYKTNLSELKESYQIKIEKMESRLKRLQLFNYFRSNHYTNITLESTMSFLKSTTICANKPIFLTLATVGDDLYWQLIENYIYTMIRFDTIDCSLVVCVSDPKCVQLCSLSNFPCYNFQTDLKITTKPSVMEQIGELKLYHIPKALSLGVDVFMLDLDIGFLDNPMIMVEAFRATPHVDIFVQEDMIYVMNRSKSSWKSWKIEKLPNIGLFLCRGNNKTTRVFNRAWDKYSQLKDPNVKKNPGKDQNFVLDAMRYGRAKFGLRYAYFSNKTAVLLDKMKFYQNSSVELGGDAAYRLLHSQHALAVHMTCYEHTVKVLGMKAVNSFWNPRYYDPMRLTLTMPIVYISKEQLLNDVRSLLWLGVVTNRSVIIPNLLGPDTVSSGGEYNGRKYWPGFRVVKVMTEYGISFLKTNILEPGFYWRVQHDYATYPAPEVVTYNNAVENSLNEIKKKILLLSSQNRVVIHGSTCADARCIEATKRWALSSVGYFEGSYSAIRSNYSGLPSLKTVPRHEPMMVDVLRGLRTCRGIFGRSKGNRSCFDICD